MLCWFVCLSVAMVTGGCTTCGTESITHAPRGRAGQGYIFLSRITCKNGGGGPNSM